MGNFKFRRKKLYLSIKNGIVTVISNYRISKIQLLRLLGINGCSYKLMGFLIRVNNLKQHSNKKTKIQTLLTFLWKLHVKITCSQ